MSFQPFVIGSGLAGWSVLKSTLPSQKAAFNNGFQNRSDTEYFRYHFNIIETVDDIVNDRRFMRVLLGAYGLSHDIENTQFIKIVLSEGVSEPSALANKLTDRRYRNLARNFDFSTSPLIHKNNKNLLEQTITNYQNQSFETAIGKKNVDMRMMLSFSREIKEISNSTKSNTTAWYQILATRSLREVIQTALGLPSAFAQLDIDDQHERIVDRVSHVFDTALVSELAIEAKSEEITQRFLLMRETENTTQNSSLQNALFLLGGG